MRYLLPLIVLFSATFGFSQNPPPPPPPPVRITSPAPPPPPPAEFRPPASADIKPFQSFEDPFAIDFAGSVRTNVEESGQFTIRNYEARRMATLAKVIVYDFGAETHSKLDKEGFVKDLKDELLRVRGTEIFSEIPLEIDGYPAVDLEFGDRFSRYFTRVVFTDSRVFRLYIDIVNWGLHSNDMKQAFNTEKSRFFDSFEVQKGLPTKSDVVASILESPAKADDIDGWSRYKFDDSRFAVLMPAPPEEEIEPIQFGPFSTRLITQSSEGEYQIFSIGYMNFGFDIADPVEIEGFFDSWEEGLIEVVTDPKIERATITFQGRRARRTTAINDVIRLDGLAQYIDGRLVQMFVIGPGSGLTDEESAQNSRLADKFLESFVYTASETKSDEPVSTIEYIAEGTRYKSDEYLFEIELPAGWQRIDDQTFRKGLQSASDDGNITAKGKRDLEKSGDKTEMLFAFATRLSENKGQASFICGVEIVQNIQRTGSRPVAFKSYENFKTNLGYEGVAPPTLTRMGGTSFYVFRVRKEVNGVMMNQIIYMKQAKNKMLQFVLTYDLEFLRTEMEKTLETLKFDPSVK